MPGFKSWLCCLSPGRCLTFATIKREMLTIFSAYQVLKIVPGIEESSFSSDHRVRMLGDGGRKVGEWRLSGLGEDHSGED